MGVVCHCVAVDHHDAQLEVELFGIPREITSYLMGYTKPMDAITNILQMFLSFLLGFLTLIVNFFISILQLILGFAQSIVSTVR